MLQLYRIMSIDGIFMLQIKNPFFTSFIISSGFQFPGAMHVHAILTRGIKEYPVARIDEFGTVSKRDAVSLLCMWLHRFPSSTSTFLVAGTPSSSYLYHPRLDGIVGSSITLSSEDPILVPSFPAHHAPPAHAISFPRTLSASDGWPKISCASNATKSGFMTTVAFSSFTVFASSSASAFSEIDFDTSSMLFFPVIISRPPLPPSVVLT